MQAFIFTFGLIVALVTAAAAADTPAGERCDVEAAHQRYAKRCHDAEELEYRDAVWSAAEMRKARRDGKRGVVAKRDGFVRPGQTDRQRFESEEARQEWLDTAEHNLRVYSKIIARHNDEGRGWAPLPLPDKPKVGDMGTFEGHKVRVISVASSEEAELTIDGRRCLFIGNTRDMVPDSETTGLDPREVVLVESVEVRRVGSIERELLVLRQDSLIDVAHEIRRLRSSKGK